MGRAFVQSSKLNPHLREEDQDMEMTPTVFGPPAFGSPDPETEGGRLVPLNEHPLKGMMDKDYAADHLARGADGGVASVAEGETLSDKSVEELKDMARDKEITGFSNMKKDELVAAIEEHDASKGEDAEEES